MPLPFVLHEEQTDCVTTSVTASRSSEAHGLIPFGEKTEKGRVYQSATRVDGTARRKDRVGEQALHECTWTSTKTTIIESHCAPSSSKQLVNAKKTKSNLCSLVPPSRQSRYRRQILGLGFEKTEHSHVER